jgi:colanic acid/amylovoran biosynthesis glycosyltransferase
VSAPSGASNHHPHGAPTRPLTVAYVMSRFPKVTETFILREVLALEAQGHRVELYPLVRQREPVVHPEAAPLVERAHYLPFLSLAILRSNWWYLRRRPAVYLGTLWSVLRGTWPSPNFVVGAIGIFPKVVHASRAMVAEGVQHVHCHFATHPAVAGYVVSRLTGLPFSFTAHGSDLHVDRRMLAEKVDEAAFVVPVSGFNAQVIVEECGEAVRPKLAVVHCGVDSELFRRRPSRQRPGPFTVVCVGTLHEVKGQGYLVDACRHLVDAGVDVRAVLVGTGPDEAALRAQAARLGLADRFELVGGRTQAQVIELLQHADVLVAPSVPTRQGKREGIPVVLMEAMSCGVPVVASDLSGIPELVEDGVSGLLVPPRDAVALAVALRSLHDDPGLASRLGDGGREKVRRDFDVHASAAHLASLFGATPTATPEPAWH